VSGGHHQLSATQESTHAIDIRTYVLPAHPHTKGNMKLNINTQNGHKLPESHH
jgi:hypothetical protein